MLVVEVNRGGSGENFVYEVLLVGLARDGGAGLVEEIFEVDDLEGFPVRACMSERTGQTERPARTAWTP